MFLNLDEEKKHQYQEQNPIQSVEDVLQKLGGYSRFQIWATIILISPEMPAAMLALSPIIIGAYTPENCDPTTVMNASITSGGSYFQHSTINEEWNLFCDKSWIIDIITSLQMIGNTLGALFCSMLADRYGRKKIFYALCFSMGIFGIAAGSAINVITYGIARFFIGVAIGGMYVVYLNYLMEFLTPNFRTVCGCVSFWAVGEMLLALLGYLISKWRLLTWAISCPIFLVCISYPWLPESPRYLLCKGQTQEAIKVFNKIASCNKKDPVEPNDIYNLQRMIIKENESTDCSTKVNGVTTLLTKYCKQFVVFSWGWFTCACIYYALSFNTKNLSGNLYLNVFYLGVSDLPGYFFGIIFNNRFGRKKTLIGFLLLGTFFFLSLAVIEQQEVSNWYPIIITLLSLFGRFFTAASWAIIACFTSESFPTSRRATFVGLCALCGNIGGIISPQIVFLRTFWTTGPYIIMSVLSLITVIASTRLDEIVRKPLQDTTYTAQSVKL